MPFTVVANAVFAALADPTRRHLLTQLATGGPSTATSLAAELAISRQAVTKHLRILTEAGIAESTRIGREVRYAADLAPLQQIDSWIEQIQGAWASRLQLLAQSLEADLGDRSR